MLSGGDDEDAALALANSKQSYVDHSTYSFDSWLRIVEERFGIPFMTEREGNASDMLSAFDSSQKPRPPVLLSPILGGSPYPQPLQTISH